MRPEIPAPGYFLQTARGVVNLFAYRQEEFNSHLFLFHLPTVQKLFKLSFAKG
jgi:hypothetical protein